VPTYRLHRTARTHLPLNTDTVIAERFAHRIAEHFAEHHDLWVLPALPYGLSPEHAWAPGTISLRVNALAVLIELLLTQYARATRARPLLIVNGRGGNRGLLDAVIHELARQSPIRACAIHPNSLSTPNASQEAVLPEVHAGARETSLMCALAPTAVRQLRTLPRLESDADRSGEIHRQILDRATTRPWTSADQRIATAGVIGNDPTQASAETGEAIVTTGLAVCSTLLHDL
jgi:creatinine amidohydrolase